MAGKMWCCGGSSSSGGGSVGLAAVATADTPTVDLSGDGTAGAPISATVLVAPEPNGLEAAAGGLLVAPSAQAGNVLAVGSDGRLFVSTPADTTNVTGVTGSAPAPVGTARSVDIDVAESPADTFTVGARLSPAWGQSSLSGVNNAGNGTWSLGQQLAVSEDGIYLVEAYIDATANVYYSRASADYWISGGLFVNDVQIKAGAAVVNNWSFPSGTAVSFAASGTITLTQRMQLTAGQLVQAKVNYSGTYFTGDGFGAAASVAFNKISD